MGWCVAVCALALLEKRNTEKRIVGFLWAGGGGREEGNCCVYMNGVWRVRISSDGATRQSQRQRSGKAKCTRRVAQRRGGRARHTATTHTHKRERRRGKEKNNDGGGAALPSDAHAVAPGARGRRGALAPERGDEQATRDAKTGRGAPRHSAQTHFRGGGGGKGRTAGQQGLAAAPRGGGVEAG